MWEHTGQLSQRVAWVTRNPILLTVVPFADCLSTFEMNSETTPSYPQGEFQVWASLMELKERRGGIKGNDVQLAEALALSLGSWITV